MCADQEHSSRRQVWSKRKPALLKQELDSMLKERKKDRITQRKDRFLSLHTLISGGLGLQRLEAGFQFPTSD